MTEIKGGSDLGAAVETVAQQDGSKWRLTGDKYFASNAGAELAVVAARQEGAPQNVRGLSLFLVPRRTEDGQLNYRIRRLKDKIATRSVPTGEIELRQSEGWLLGQAEHGIYLILDVLNLSRVANCVGSVALAQRAIADAYSFAQRRMAFGKPIIEHPLLRRQFEDRLKGLRAASRLAWEAAHLLDRYGRRNRRTRRVIICSVWSLIWRNTGPQSSPCRRPNGRWKCMAGWERCRNIALSGGFARP